MGRLLTLNLCIGLLRCFSVIILCSEWRIILRIIYNYIFDVTKKLRREELIPCILHFMQQNNLKYENVLFELSSYKDNRRKGKTYFEKLWEKDLFWRKYFIER